MIVAFSIGLFSALHCFGMCGGLVGAMMMSLKPSIRDNPSQLMLYALTYNAGRISSYVVAGFLLGWLGQTLRELLMPSEGVAVLRLLASCLIIAMGLYIAGWFPGFARLEKIGNPLWRHLQPYGQKLMPVKNLRHAFLFGAIWGWLPCGLIYTVLLISPAKESAASAALFMFVFGLGTLIPMLSAGFLSGRLSFFRQSTKVRHISGLLLIFMGMLGFWLAVTPEAHQILHFHIF